MLIDVDMMNSADAPKRYKVLVYWKDKLSTIVKTYAVIKCWQVHDELGFVAIPPCLWGEPEVHSHNTYTQPIGLI